MLNLEGAETLNAFHPLAARGNRIVMKNEKKNLTPVMHIDAEWTLFLRKR
jgi:hypothetical protein